MATKEELQAKVAALESRNEDLEQTNAISYKVSTKGAVSVYGLGRFPTTLYKEQWGRVLDDSDNLRAFIKTNNSQLKAKGA